MYRKIAETNTLDLTEKKTIDFFNLFSCRFHTLAYWLTFNSEILTLLSHEKHTNDYDFIIDFIIDFMYILVPMSPLNKVHLKVRDLYFVKYMCFLKYVHMCLTSPFQKKKKKEKNHCQCNYECCFSQIRLPFSLSIFLNPLR